MRCAARKASTGARRSRERGHLLIDYIIASSFFLGTLAAFTTATAARSRTIAEAEARTRAVLAAESAVAELHAGVAVASEAPVAALRDGLVRVESRSEGSVRRVRVVVTWRDPAGGAQELELWTIAP